MTDFQLYTKISGLPADLKSEISDFIDFLKYKSKKYKKKDQSRKSGIGKGLIFTKTTYSSPNRIFSALSSASRTSLVAR